MKNGITLWRGASPVDGAPLRFVATGLVRPSQNVGTGAMIQTYILRDDIHPQEAIRTGQDASVCGDCVHRGRDGAARTCYVQVWRDPAAVWRTTYPHGDASRLKGRKVRLGTYGDPGMLPLDVLRSITGTARSWTGYTHRWRELPGEYAGILMASCDSLPEYREARAAGWRAFLVVPRGSEGPAGTVQCPKSLGERQCVDCLACGGTREGTVKGASVWIEVHGAAAGKFH